ncbi:MAG: sugar ABC transporter substrate-binding protein [Microbacterium enclense]
MLNKRAALVVGIMLAVGVTVSGCSRDSRPGADTTPATLSDGPATGTIELWAQGTEADLLGTVVKGFEDENPDVTVNITAIPWASAHQKYQTAIAGGSTPDLAQMGTTWMADFANAFAEVPAAVDTSGIFDSATSAATVAGKTVGVPWYVDVRALFYRTDLAEKAGYATPPRTWTELKDMAAALQSKAGATYGIQLPTGATADDFQGILPFLWSSGASLTDADESKWTLDTPEMVNGMAYVNSYFEDGIADRNPNTAVGGVVSGFVDGTAPMLVTSPIAISLFNEAGGSDFDSKIGVAPLPTEKSATSFVGGSDLVVFKDAPNADAAWKLVQYLNRPEVQADFYTMSGDLPAQESAWSTGTLGTDARLQVFKEQLDDAKSPPALTTWTQVSAAGDKALESMVRGGVSPEDALRQLQSAADTAGMGR